VSPRSRDGYGDRSCWSLPGEAAANALLSAGRVAGGYPARHAIGTAHVCADGGSPAPGANDPAWGYLRELGLVWRDAEAIPSEFGLTSAGRGYATDY
jgi:hypothetical protein